MNKRKNLVVGIALLSVLALLMSSTNTLAQSFGDQPGNQLPRPVFRPNNSTVTIQNFSVQIITDTVPLFRLGERNQPDEMYLVRLDDLIEFNDTNSDGIPQPTERAPGGTLPLSAGDWDVSELLNETEGEDLKAIHFNYTLVNITSPKFENLILQYRFHLYVDNTTVNTGDLQTFVVGSSELKFDVLIENWPWVSEGNQLALRILLTSTHGRTLRHRHIHQTRAMTWENATGDVQAYFRYEDQVMLRNNTDFYLRNITSGLEENGTTPYLYLVYPYFGDQQLIHDPTLGLQIGSSTTGTSTFPSINELISSPLFVGGLSLIVIVVTTVALRKRN
ncbi:MAG: hypothetical protein ACXACA_08400 [Candidatus Ranarchaeia archaeon]